MIILALELSTKHGSVALHSEKTCLAETAWEAGRRSGDKLFQAVQEILGKASIQLAEVDLFVVGRGPGSYSGLRISMTAARGFALPDKKPVYAISSGEILAIEIAEEKDATTVLVLGDARQNSLWTGRYDVGQAEPITWKTLQNNEEIEDLPADAWIVSPDLEALQAYPEPAKILQRNGIPKNRYPCARKLAERAFQKIEQKVPTEPLHPIYAHPAVR